MSKYYNEYKKNPKKFEYLTQFQYHCEKTEPIAYHNCEKFKAKFIIIKNEDSNNNIIKNNKNNKLNKSTNFGNKKIINNEEFNNNKEDLENTYVICTECKTCYPSNCIILYCTGCKNDYYSQILPDEQDLKILPATWVKYHCNIIVNDSMKCIKCNCTFYLNLDNLRLECQNSRCKF